MFKILEKNPVLFICLLVGIMLMPNINSLSVTIMEARNFITAREMVTDGHWLLTTMNGEARYEKPPLPTWLTAISSLIFGLKSVFGLRLPAIFMIMVIGVFVFKLSQLITNNITHSIINSLIAITSFYVIGIIIEAPWDIYTHAFMLVGIYHVFKLFQNEHTNWKNSIIAGLFIGLSFMSKGPISIYALLLPFLIAYGFSYKYHKIKEKALSIFGVLLVAIIVGTWWYIFVRLKDPTTFSAIAQKETGNWSSYNTRPFYYYWSFFTQSGLWTIPAFISLLYPYLKSRVSNLKGYQLSLFWTLIAVVMLSVIPEKKSRYLMPVLIPLSINIGFYFQYLILHFKSIKDKRETFPVYFNFGLMALIGISFPVVAYTILKDNLTGIDWFWYISCSLLLLTIGVLISIQLKKKNIKSLLLLTISLFVSLSVFGLPLSKVLIEANYETIQSLHIEASKEQIKIYGLNDVSPEIIWYFGNKIPSIKLSDNSFDFPEENRFGLLVNKISPEDMKLLSSIYIIKKVSTYDLNTAPIESKKHKDRLEAHYYILIKKT